MKTCFFPGFDAKTIFHGGVRFAWVAEMMTAVPS
jgi:hypothetical protein